MNIVERLNYFLELTGITKSQFADNCEIPRPTASQILSGRNKKISDDIIGKIHSIYPNLSVSWLMFGEGEMFSTANGLATSSKPSEISIFGECQINQPKETTGDDTKSSLFNNNHLNNKEITKIVVFYSDNSFEEFYRK